jgi:large subunit ribosomal protein L9
MKVILVQNVPNLGSAGDVVDVKPGYGRNYLFARGLAEGLSKKAIAEVEELKKAAVRRADRELKAARDLASKLQGHVVKLEGKAGARGAKLYGSITSQALANSISQFLGIEIDKRKITISEQIKSLGMHNYTIRLHPEVEVEGRVEVVKAATPVE